MMIESGEEERREKRKVRKTGIRKELVKKMQDTQKYQLSRKVRGPTPHTFLMSCFCGESLRVISRVACQKFVEIGESAYMQRVSLRNTFNEDLT